MLRKVGFLFMVILMITSCKTKSAVVGTAAKPMTANKVIKNHYSNSFDKETLSAKMKVKYRGKNDLPGVTASMRIKKDEAIWISLSKLGFPVGKALITKDKVSYYEKINKTYFEGDFALLSKWLGTDLDYEKVQNLLFGQAILDLKNDKHDVALKDRYYELTPKKANELFDILYLLNPENFKLIKQQVTQSEENKSLSIDYGNYQRIDDEFFPKDVLITAKDHRYTTTINVEYRSIEFNKSLRFPFSIPNGYKEIELK
ncbi:MAG: DUF4292 domain-containing protein [Flavobacteriaceae bacterium]|nr:DUF4292 domain-containing protein [Flavobacteriaceae bacterium]